MSDYDVILYGATGFTGRQTARHFAAHAPPGLRWAVAGRHAGKLEALAAETKAAGFVVADSGDAGAVDAMVARARVLLTTAGPFSKYGTPVVEACVRHGVDYVDITGETPWVRELVDRHHAAAAARGTRIVPFCGFDSVPSDLGALLVVDHFRRAGQGTRRVSASFAMRGGVNGGSLDTALTMAETGRDTELADPVLLNPPERRTDEERARNPDRRGSDWDPVRKTWLAPFVMAQINTRVVRRSAALAEGYGETYGSAFAYDEAMELRSRGAAWATATGLAAFERALRRPFGRRLVRAFGPKPGQGPSDRTMDGGFFRTRLVGEADDGRRVLVTISADGDPGNRVTVAILCEAAIQLAVARDTLPGGATRGGLLTPATALGLPLVDRLRARDFRVDIADLAPA
jgi:short subunit dehydrogenase-like uncharacterized protein